MEDSSVSPSLASGVYDVAHSIRPAFELDIGQLFFSHPEHLDWEVRREVSYDRHSWINIRSCDSDGRGFHQASSYYPESCWPFLSVVGKCHHGMLLADVHPALGLAFSVILVIPKVAPRLSKEI